MCRAQDAPQQVNGALARLCSYIGKRQPRRAHQALDKRLRGRGTCTGELIMEFPHPKHLVNCCPFWLPEAALAIAHSSCWALQVTHFIMQSSILHLTRESLS